MDECNCVSPCLVAGTTVGAGMLALPAVTQASGFIPSTVTLTGCWLYMVGPSRCSSRRHPKLFYSYFS